MLTIKELVKNFGDLEGIMTQFEKKTERQFQLRKFSFNNALTPEETAELAALDKELKEMREAVRRSWDLMKRKAG